MSPSNGSNMPATRLAVKESFCPISHSDTSRENISPAKEETFSNHARGYQSGGRMQAGDLDPARLSACHSKMPCAGYGIVTCKVVV